MNADARKAAERLQRWANDHRKMGEPTTTVLYQDVRSVAEAILYASPSPSPALTREAVARIIDPSTWRVLDNYLAETKRKYKDDDAAYDPEAFKDKKSLALADAILALTLPPAPQGWRDISTAPGGVGEPMAYRYRYYDPGSGKPVWVLNEGGLWNGQRPHETQPLYAHPATLKADVLGLAVAEVRERCAQIVLAQTKEGEG